MTANAKNAKGDDTSKAVATREISNDELLEISSFEDAIALVEEVYGTVLLADQVIGNGFRMLANKSALVGKGIVLLKWKFLPGDFAREYVNMLIVTEDGDRYLVNDGSTGIAAQLREYSDRADRFGGMVVRNGFTESSYTFCSEPGCVLGAKCQEEGHKRTPASTFYLDLTA